MNDACAEMPQYQCHKRVWALPIKEVRQSPADHVVDGGSWDLVPDDNRYGPITVTHGWYEKHQPVAGGYYVAYTDGYASFSPKGAFEEGYSPIATNAPAKLPPTPDGCQLIEMAVGLEEGSAAGWVFARHVEGQWVSVAKLQPFGLSIMRYAAERKRA